ncbi:MAG TPA: MBL fold metallo-hydrolase [bacterium]|nr:MBL fold metallo-hydrolase [bacterium]
MGENGTTSAAIPRGTSLVSGVGPAAAHTPSFGELRQRLGPSLPAAARRELESLGAESDPELQAMGLLGLASRLEHQGHEALALQVLQTLQELPSVPADLRHRAQIRQAALNGQGAPIGARAEVLFRRFGGEVTNPSALFAMGAAGAVFRLARLGALSRFAASPASALTRGRLASPLASTLGFLAEAPAFTLAHRAADAMLDRPLDWSGESLRRELTSSFIALGAMRLVGATPSFVRRGLGGGRTAAATSSFGVSANALPLPGPPLPKGREFLEPTLALYAGILLGHGLEMGLGLRPTQSFDELLFDSAAMLVQFHVAGNLSRRAFGANWSRWENGLELQSRQLAAELRSGPALSLANPALLGPPLPEVLQMTSTSHKGSGGLRLVSSASRAGESSGPPSLPPEKIRALPRGGVLARTAAGWIQFGVPMWTNKDLYEIFIQANGYKIPAEEIREHLPRTYIFDLDYVPRHDGLLPADFMQYMYYVNRGMECALVAPDAPTAQRLREFLDLSYQGPRSEALTAQVEGEYPAGAVGRPRMGEEISRGFPAEAPETLRRISHLNQAGEYLDGEVRVVKLGPLRYEIFESGTSQGVLDLKDHPMPPPASEELHSPELTRARRKVLSEGRPAIWPIGTGHGFTFREETSGFLLWNGGQAVVVDPPSSTVEFLRRHRLPLSKLQGILLTHGHTDHYGNAVPQLLQSRPDLKVYTTPTINRMLRRQYELAIGGNVSWNFVPLYPQSFTNLLGLHLRPEYSFHPVPAIGFEIYDRPDVRAGRLALSFTGDTYADHVDLWRHTQGENPLMSVARATQVLRHGALLMASKGQNPPPVFLIEGGIPPIHINPLRTRELLDQAETLGVDTSRVRVYHVAGDKAAEARVPKWPAGVEGFFDLSGYFKKRR